MVKKFAVLKVDFMSKQRNWDLNIATKMQVDGTLWYFMVLHNGDFPIRRYFMVQYLMYFWILWFLSSLTKIGVHIKHYFLVFQLHIIIKWRTYENKTLSQKYLIWSLNK